jgi:hypothetical protein
MDQPGTISDVMARFEATYRPLVARNDEKRHFHGVYYRNTIAVKDDMQRGGFLDPGWVEPWDVVFANLYLDALEQWNRGEQPPGPWRVAFQAAKDPSIPPLRHVLVGLNAHLNYDLPQAFLAVVTDEEFDQPALLSKRQQDFQHIDSIVVSRVKEEDLELNKVEEPGDRTLVDRMLTPFNRLASKRFLKEARAKVWRNTGELSRARRRGPDAYARRLQQLEALSVAKVQDLLAPGQVLLRLARDGYGVLLPAGSDD